MYTEDNWAQVLTAATLFRAAELANGKPFTQEQVGLYMTHYEGKYSRKTLEAGVGCVVIKRLKSPSLMERVFGLKPKSSELEKTIERKAGQILQMPGARQEIEILLGKIRGAS